MKWPDRLPPSIAIILTVVIIGPLSALGGYYYATEKVGRDLAEANLNNVIDGETKAAEIRIELERNLEPVERLKERVNNGEIKISKDGFVNPAIAADFLQSIQQAKP